MRYQLMASSAEYAAKQNWSDVLPGWLSLLKEFLTLKPFSRTNPEGVRRCLALTSALLAARGFAVDHYENPSPDGAGILIASRAPRGRGTFTVGMFGHVDIENVRPSQLGKWKSSNPLEPELLSDGRYYCRGIADNLGPLLARILSFRASDTRSSGVVWVIQGEEETGSHFAHSILPALKKTSHVFDPVMLWIEETGYFTSDGTQRVLAMHGRLNFSVEPPESSLAVVDFALRALSSNAGDHKIAIFERFLNKSFGSNRCPCLEHLVDGSVPYISFGMNDVLSCIHDIDESVPAKFLVVAFEQFNAVTSVC